MSLLKNKQQVEEQERIKATREEDTREEENGVAQHKVVHSTPIVATSYHGKTTIETDIANDNERLKQQRN